MSTPKELQPALRQYRHNCGDDTLLIGFDYEETVNAFEALEQQIAELKANAVEHDRLEDDLNQILHPNGDGPKAPSFCDLIAYVRFELAAISSTWIPVEDRLPEDGHERCLLHRELGEGTNDVVGYRGNDKWVKFTGGYSELEHVTHWMPIPSVESDT